MKTIYPYEANKGSEILRIRRQTSEESEVCHGQNVVSITTKTSRLTRKARYIIILIKHRKIPTNTECLNEFKIYVHKDICTIINRNLCDYSLLSVPTI